MSITEKRLDEIQERLEAATDGPWFVEYESEECPPFRPYAYAIHGPTMQGVLESQVSDDYKAQYGHQMDEVAGVADDDAELIAHAPTDLADLLAEVHRLRAELAKTREVTENMVERAAEAWYVAQNPGMEDWALSAWADMGGSEPSEERSVATLAAHAALTAALGGGDDA